MAQFCFSVRSDEGLTLETSAIHQNLTGEKYTIPKIVDQTQIGFRQNRAHVAVCAVVIVLIAANLVLQFFSDSSKFTPGIKSIDH